MSIDRLTSTEYDLAVAALLTDTADALTSDSGILTYYAQQYPEKLVVVGEKFSHEPYGIGVPNYDDRFQDLVNFTLQEMKKDGTYDRLYKQWFGNDSEPYPIEIWPGESYLPINLVPMLYIPEGEFIRGGEYNNAPKQTIFLDEFYIDQYEVTNILYQKCVQEGSCQPPKSISSVNSKEYYILPEFRHHPVIQVTWEDAQTYCQFVGKRLPTEAEWEKAARGTDGLTYPWGDDPPSKERANFDSSTDLVAVGSYPDGTSPYGAYDMAGNAWEWVADWYQHDYYQQAPKENPQGPEKATNKVIRGGAWQTKHFTLEAGRRKNRNPSAKDSDLSFRCASSTPPPLR